jgi:hypothetical protein
VQPNTRRRIAGALLVAVLAACDTSPNPSPSGGAVTPSEPPGTGAPSRNPGESPAPQPTPTFVAPASFRLAVVTGLETLKSVVKLGELEALASSGDLVVPCGVSVTEPVLEVTAACLPADAIAAAIQDDQDLIALLPPGLVEPATKVLPIDGDGPFGLFGADLFGDPEARALPYPIVGTATGQPALDASWLQYDASKVWTMTSIGSLCADRYAARQAVTNGKGWDWVFGGGTAKYTRKPRLNPNPPPGIDRNLFVEPVETGSDGVVGQVQKRADVAIADHECPIQANKDWRPNPGNGLSFAVPEAVVDEWQDTLGLDAVYLAANHMSDRGVAGIRSTLRILDKRGLPRTGLGMNLDEGLEPAYVEVAGLKVAFVAFNDVGGVARADEDTAGVPWITRPNIREAVRRAREAGANVIMCDPQWWGGREYHDNLLPKQVKQLGWFQELGCDHVVGAGTHVAGPMLLLAQPDGGVLSVLASPGNYVFGQDFFQNLQEGVILEQKFVGDRLVNVRMHPYVIILGARPALTNPEGDGHYVLERIWKNSTLDYLP